MAKLHLVIANKNYSSWSLRPWMAMTMAGLPFDETMILLDTPTTKKQIAEHSGAGRLPVLHHGKITIWETLAILEYLAETFPEKNLWPKSKAARAVARAVSNEMHAGFTGLRNACPDEPQAASKTRRPERMQRRPKSPALKKSGENVARPMARAASFSSENSATPTPCSHQLSHALKPMPFQLPKTRGPIWMRSLPQRHSRHGKPQLSRKPGSFPKMRWIRHQARLTFCWVERVTLPASSSSSRMPRTTAAESLLSLIMSSTSIGVGDRSESTSLRSEALASADSSKGRFRLGK